MNADSEQITADKNLIIDQDQPLGDKGLQSSLLIALGESNCKISYLSDRKWVLEYQTEFKKFHLLVRSCTYLGNPHPIYKKRIQLPLWFNQYCNDLQKTSPDIEVRFIGVYNYQHDFYGQNIIFIDFDKTKYLLKKGHNSSAHVYTNDLFQAMNYGIFRKEDQSGNIITTIRFDQFKNYIDGKNKNFGNELFDLFSRFNYGFTFGQWLNAIDAIKEMHQNNWHQWKQAEWAGWFLEYRFNKFTTEEHLTNKMRYVGTSLKRNVDLDFDIRFDEADFYGDLKASDINKREAPGNDQKNFIECIRRYDKFWYVIYEHETIKDSADSEYSATIARNTFIKQIDPSYKKGPLSYHNRMKSKVRFVKMTIIELNRMNYREVLKSFNQGHQADGSSRNPKFSINKSVLNNDNYVVFRYSFKEDA